jgi:hypothetical protein
LTVEEAEHHFGQYDGSVPICQVAAETYRALEREVQSYRSECDADTVLFYRLGADHATAARNAEQAGYDRGLKDARYSDLVEAACVLRELFCGDTVHMALAGNPNACEAMEARIASAVAKVSPIIGEATTALETGSAGTTEGRAPSNTERPEQ